MLCNYWKFYYYVFQFWFCAQRNRWCYTFWLNYSRLSLEVTWCYYNFLLKNTFLWIIGPRICGICIKSSIRKVKCNKLLCRLKWLLLYYSKKDTIDFGLVWWSPIQMNHPSILWVYCFLHNVTKPKPKPKSLAKYEMDIYYPWCWLIGLPSKYLFERFPPNCVFYTLLC